MVFSMKAAEKQTLTSHRVGPGHEVERDGMSRVRHRVLQAPLRDFIEAVRGGGHVFIHPIEEGVRAH